MPEMDGVEATRIKKMYPEIKIIVLTTFDDDEYVLMQHEKWSQRMP